MSNFESVQEFNTAFEVAHGVDQIPLRLSLIEEEFQELKDAVKANDRTEIVDALADILYVVYGMGDVLEIDMNAAFKAVHESNMSKLCDTEEEAAKTVEAYKEKAAEYDAKNPLQAPLNPEWKKKDNGKYVVFNATTGKVLKSIFYNAVDLSGY